MQPQTPEEYKKLLTDVIKKQIVVLGPNITLAKARNVKGLTVSDDGTITEIVGDPQQVTQQLIDQFMELSGLIVKKTMEPLFSIHKSSPVTSNVQITTPVQQSQNPVNISQGPENNTNS